MKYNGTLTVSNTLFKTVHNLHIKILNLRIKY